MKFANYFEKTGVYDTTLETLKTFQEKHPRKVISKAAVHEYSKASTVFCFEKFRKIHRKTAAMKFFR